MKNRSMNLFILSAVAFSTLTIMPQEADPSMWAKITTFAQKHKKEIIAGGLAVVAAALGASAAVYLNKKADEAIQKAGIDVTKKYHQDYKDARDLITYYGLLGANIGIASLKRDKDDSAISYIATSNAGHALANFWDIGQQKLAQALGRGGLMK